VTRDGTRLDRLGDRGQLLLVGAVAVALIILGIVVVFNTILFTETREPTQSLDDTTNAGTLRVQVMNSTRKLVQFTANSSDWNCSSSSGKFESAIEANLTGAGSFGEGLTQIKAKGGVRYVTVESATASCIGPDTVEVETDLVIRTPETDYRTTIVREYEPEP
jgi:predicted PurR-regulated permease PerM